MFRRPIRYRGQAQKLQVTKAPNSRPIAYSTSMEDSTTFDHQNIGTPDVLLGLYGLEDWIFANFTRKRYLAGETTVQVDVTWLADTSFDLVAWAKGTGERYTFMGANRALITTAESIVKVTTGRGKIEVEHVGSPACVQNWVDKFDRDFKRAENLIEWVYSSQGHEISVPLNYRPAIQAAYPWLHKSVDDYIDDYLDSTASVIILLGEPGTGKTTFIKNLIHRSGANAKVAYDENVMKGDQLFAGFIDGDCRFMVMEDADAFLQARTDGNTMMHKFLNVSDGLISAADKKLVFSTNLPNISDIDEALMRPGRCYDVVKFRKLTHAEALKVVAEVGFGTVPDQEYVTLAQLFAQQPIGHKPVRAPIGFRA